jgi:hypothetical protein
MKNILYRIAENYADEFAAIICSERMNEQFEFYAVKRHVTEAIMQALLEFKKQNAL